MPVQRQPSHRRCRRVLGGALLWLAASNCVSVAQTAAVVAPAVDPQTIERATQLINQMRAKVIDCEMYASLRTNAVIRAIPPARPALKWNPLLAAAAQHHSSQMASTGHFEHEDLRGDTVASRSTAVGYRWRAIGENIAAGQTSLDEAFGGWLQSLEHCQNIVDPRFTEFGLAVARSAKINDEFGTYWTLVLGTPKS